MDIESMILFALLIPFRVSQFIVLPDSHLATVENREETKTTCTIIDIFHDVESSFNMEKIVTTICNTPNHTIPKLSSSDHIYILQNDYRQIKKVSLWDAMFFKPEHASFQELKEKFGHEKIAEVASLLSSNNIQENFAVVSKILSWKGSELVKFFKYNEKRANDAWEAMKFKQLQCNQVNKIELHVCGNINEHRKFGEHKFVATLGMFSPRGSLYKYLDIPSHAVAYNNEIISVESCRFLYTYYECYYSLNTKCTIHDHSNCTEIVKLSTSKIIVNVYGEYTVVAADIDEYQTMVNDSVASHHMDHSKHVVLRLPYGTYAKFNNIKVYGNATHGYDHFAVHNVVHSSNITGNDLEALRKQYGDHEEIENHRSMVVVQSENRSIPIIFWCIFVIILLLAIITRCVFCTRSIPKKESNTQPLVIYRGENVQINEF